MLKINHTGLKSGGNETDTVWHFQNDVLSDDISSADCALGMSFQEKLRCAKFKFEILGTDQKAKRSFSMTYSKQKNGDSMH